MKRMTNTLRLETEQLQKTVTCLNNKSRCTVHIKIRSVLPGEVPNSRTSSNEPSCVCRPDEKSGTQKDKIKMK